MPLANKASSETVARALTLLRLTRWMTLRRKCRANNGCLQGNLYFLHEEPLPFYETLHFDEEYLEFISKCLTHASKAIRCVAHHILGEIKIDPGLISKRHLTQLEHIHQRIAAQNKSSEISSVDYEPIEHLSTDEGVSKSELSLNDLVRNHETPNSESESGLEPAQNQAVRNPNSDVRSSSIYKIRTTEESAENQHPLPLRLPDRFKQLPQTKQKTALASMKPLEFSLQQAILDEWAVRCQSGQVRRPESYLFGMIQKAFRGEFNVFKESESSQRLAAPPPPTTPPPSRSPPTPEEEEEARYHLNNIKAMLQTWKINKTL